MRNLLTADRINTISFLLSALANGLISFCFFSDNATFYFLLNYLFFIFFLYNAANAFVRIFTKAYKPTTGITLTAVNLFMAYITKTKPAAFMPFIIVLFAAYVLIIAFTSLYTAFLYIKDGNGNVVSRTLAGLGFLLFGIWLLINPVLKTTLNFKTIIALYFMFAACSELLDFIEQILPAKFIGKLRDKNTKKIAPIINSVAGTFVPSRFLAQIKKHLVKFPFNGAEELKVRKAGETATLEIFFHVAPTKWGKLGHTDIFFKDKVYSFGNYDDASYRLGGIAGDGVFEVVDREKYLNYSTTKLNKTIVSFGIKLTETQQARFINKAETVIKNLVPWQPPLERALKENKNADIAEYTDYASRMYYATGAKFYKLKKGKFKSYFGLNNNCARFTNTLISSAGLDSVNPAGVITPGMYYEYLNRELRKNKSAVVSREVFFAESILKSASAMLPKKANKEPLNRT